MEKASLWAATTIVRCRCGISVISATRYKYVQAYLLIDLDDCSCNQSLIYVKRPLYGDV